MPPVRSLWPVRPMRDGWSPLDLPIETIDRAALVLLGIGPEVEVVEPVELRQSIGAIAGQIVRRAGA